MPEEREREELRVQVSVYKAKQACDSRLQAILGAKVQLFRTRADLERAVQEQEATKLQAQQARRIAALECDLAKSKVDLHRWRQRTALLKVRLSSVQEDVERYQRVAGILLHQSDLELEAKRGYRGQAAGLREQLGTLTGRMQAQAEALAALRSEARQLAAAVANRDDQLAQLQANLELSGEEQQAALATEQAKCTRLHEQLVAVEERVRLTEAALAAEQGRAQQAEHALQQERAMFAANQTLHTGLTSMAQMMDANVQAQLREAQEALREKERRERELEQRCQRLEGKLELKQRHLASLQQVMQQPDDGTPARGVAAVLNSVGQLTQQLAGGLTPESELKLHQPVLSQPSELGAGGGDARASPAGSGSPAAAAAQRPRHCGQAVGAPQAAVEERPKGRGGKAKAAKQAPKPEPAAAKPKARKQAAKPAAAAESDDGWSDDDSQDAGHLPAKPAGAKGSRGQQQPKQQRQTNKAAPKAAKAALPAAPLAEPAVPPSGRPARQRSSKVPYWMGGSAAAVANEAGTAASPGSPGAESEEEEAERPQEARRKRSSPKQRTGAGPSMQTGGQPRASEERAAYALAALAGAAPASGRKRKQPDVPSMTHEEDVEQEAAAEEEEEPAQEQQQAAKAKAHKRPAKGPANATKYDLTQEAGGKQKRAAGSKPKLGPRVEEAAGGQENVAAAALPAGQEQRQPAQRHLRAKLEDRPLDALNKNVIAAAEWFAQLRPGSGLSFKAGLQNAMAKRSLGGSQEQQQPGKRKLLAVSTSSLAAVKGDALPAQALFGNSFKVPKLAGSRGT
eukprot:scaffold1.g5807.t1